MLKSNHVFLTGAGAAVFFVVLFLYPMIRTIDKPQGDHGDTVYNYFIEDSLVKNLLTGDLGHLFDGRMFYPGKQTLTYGNSQVLQSVMALPLYLLTHNIFIASHIVVLFHFAAAYTAMFMLAYMLTGSVGGGLIAGLIYTYNPFIMAHIQHFEGVTLEWIPLLFIAAEQLLRTGKARWFAAGAVFWLCQLTSNFYYTLYVSLLLPIYMGLRLYIGKIPVTRVITLRAVPVAILTLLLALLFLSPYRSSKQGEKMSRTLEDNVVLSTQPGDFLFPSRNNRLYGWMVDNPSLQRLRDPFTAVHYTEHSLFFGVTVWFLLGSCIVLYFRKRYGTKERPVVLVYLILFGTAVVLSFGPYVRVGGGHWIVAPYYLIYRFIPMANALRVPSRLIVPGYVALAVLCAYSWKRWETKLKPYAVFVLLAILTLITVEYYPSLPPAYEFKPAVMKFYRFLALDKDSRVILEYPIANSLIKYPALYRDGMDDSQYLLYAVYHDKKIVNGYNSYVPSSVELMGDLLTVNFPTGGKLDYLRNMGVDLLIIHLEEYRDPNVGRSVIDRLRLMGMREAYTSDDIVAFRL